VPEYCTYASLSYVPPRVLVKCDSRFFFARESRSKIERNTQRTVVLAATCTIEIFTGRAQIGVANIVGDGGGASWIEAELPAPNLVVVNPRNGHAHLIYLLGGWIRTDFGDPSRLKVVRYAAAIARAYAAVLGADRAYSGRFHHNPLSDTYIIKVGRDAPYSLAELAQYVDLVTPATKPAPFGIGRNVEVFDRLRRWAYTAIADWKIGTHDAWHEAVARRAGQIAADVGAASPRGPLKKNEVGHIAKSVARWVWERYVAGVPPLLREAQIAAQREREREQQKAREAARERARLTRDEYTAQTRKRRSEAAEKSDAADAQLDKGENRRVLPIYVDLARASTDCKQQNIDGHVRAGVRLATPTRPPYEKSGSIRTR